MQTTTSPDICAEAKPYISSRAAARNLWLKLHRWLGIALLIPMALLGFTGSMQVWPEETEALLNPAREVAANADPAMLGVEHIAAARSALSEYGPMAQVEIGEVGSALTATSAAYAPPTFGIAGPTARQVWIDPSSGQVLDDAPTSGTFMWYMHFVHGLLLIPEIGRQVVGWMGVFLLVSAITGLVVFWPGRRRFFAALKWQKQQGKAINIHRQTGVILSLVLIVEAITGAWISFPRVMASLIEPGVEQPERRRPGGPEGTPLVMEDAAWIAALQTASAAFPGRPMSIAAPIDPAGAWQVELAGDGIDAAVSVPLAPDTAPSVEERAQRRGPPPPTTRAGEIASTMRGVHYATIGGPLWQIIVFISGLVLTFLALSGIYIWGKRKLRRRA